MCIAAQIKVWYEWKKDKDTHSFSGLPSHTMLMVDGEY